MGLLHFHFSFFLGGPDGIQERFFVILVALWEPLGPSWGLLRVPRTHLERALEPPWHHFGDHTDLLGRYVTLSWLSWHVLGHNFESLDVQTMKIATILTSLVRLLYYFLHISLALVLAPLKCTSPLQWSIALVMGISSAPFNLTSHVQPGFGTSHPFFRACRLHL